MRASPLLVLGALLLAGCAAPGAPLEAASVRPAPLDAAAPPPDPLAWTREAYDWGAMAVQREAVAPYLVRLRGSLHAPEGDGPFPVAVLMHGNHATCEGTGATFPSAYCGTVPGQAPIPSHAGYAYLAEDLASRGVLVLSIDANDVNDGNAADAVAYGRPERGQLVLRTLQELDARVDAADVARVGLMGHSRGGEGVLEAAAQNRAKGAPFGVRAVVALAPTDFAGLSVEHEPLLVVLPSCDGDVSTQHGARVYDASRASRAPLAQVLMMGANHDFFNTEWPWDDGADDDPYCGDDRPTRMTPDEQRNASLAYVGGFLRLHLLGDEAAAPLLDGLAVPPAAACAGDDCAGRFHVARRPMARADLGEPEARGFDVAQRCWPDGADRAGFAGIPANALRPRMPGAMRACPGPWTASGAPPLLLEWSREGAILRVPAPPGAYATASLRVALVDADGPVDVVLAVTDADGRRAEANASAWSAALFEPPGEAQRELVLSDLQVPLAALPGVDAARLATLEWRVVGAAKGSMLVDDAMLR